jgi:glycosyltransferase involved in cell wall biosynthesis
VVDLAVPSISAIVATRNRAGLLVQTLDALVGQTWPREQLDIILAHTASSDNTRELVEGVARRPGAPLVRYIFVAEPGKSNAVNAALSIARGELLAFTDDDVLPEPTWLAQLASPFVDPAVDFAAGRILPRWESDPPSWLSRALYGPLSVNDNGEQRLAIGAGERDDVMAQGGNMAVRATVIARLGGLRTDLGSLHGTLRNGEDHEFFLRMRYAGCQGIYEPTALVRHWVARDRLTPGYFRRWLYENGRDVARLESSYPLPVSRLLGVPRYLWREAAVNAYRALRFALGGDRPSGFAAALRVLWFGGYIREAWLGKMAGTFGTRV